MTCASPAATSLGCSRWRAAAIRWRDQRPRQQLSSRTTSVCLGLRIGGQHAGIVKLRCVHCRSSGDKALQAHTRPADTKMTRRARPASHVTTSRRTRRLRVARRIDVTASAPRARSRQRSQRSAPRWARAIAAARPIEPEAPDRSDAAGATASHTSVSAPCSAVRRRLRISRQKRGIEVRTPGVSAQPGCMACTAIRWRDQRRASSSVRTTSIRLVCA